MQQWGNTDVVDDGFFKDDDEEISQGDKYLIFRLGTEMYGVAIEHVTEIVAMQRIAEVPDVPHFVKGVINLRGTVIPVIDLRLRFGMTEREYGDRTCIIVLRIDRTLLGVIVDTVADVDDIRESDIDPPPVFKGDEGRNRYICGLAKSADGVTILVDGRKLLEEPVTAAPIPQQKTDETPAHGGQHAAGRE